MSRINTNIPSLVAQRQLTVSQRSLSLSLERLSSGLRINRGADDPAGLIVSERLRSEISAIHQAIKNSSRAINVIATTEGALNEVASLLTDIQALVIEAANSGAFSDAETEANQLQIDSTIDSITRIANTTNFAGRKLLNGELDYVLSGVDVTHVTDVQINGASFGSRANVPVEVNVSQSAQQAELRFLQSTVGANGATINLRGNEGIVTLTFPASATSNEIVTRINSQTDATGVYADLIGTSGVGGVSIRSLDYGSNAFVSVEEMNNLTGNFTVVDRTDAQDPRTEGRDAVATINGIATRADGLKLAVSTTGLQVQMVLDESFGNGSIATPAGVSGVGTSAFVVTDGGALFQLGPQVNTNLQENIGVQSLQANRLGNSLVGYLSELKDGQAFALDQEKFREASDVVDEVITQISVLRGRLGAFERNTLQPNINQLQITSENLTSSQAVIRDTDFALETSELTRAQILVQAGNSILAIANAQSQTVLQLLGG
jgi:flagellin